MSYIKHQPGRTVSSILLGVMGFCCMSENIAGAATIAENVCIDFGEENKYDSSTGWNIQEGQKTSTLFADRETTTLTDKQTGTSSDIKVTFERATGVSVGNYTPTTESSTLTAPTKEMQDVWELMHEISLTGEEVNSYWTEVIGLGIGASVGDLTVQNLKTNSTYAISAVVTSAKVLTLVGQAAPLNMKDNTAIDQKAAFITSNKGSVNLELAIGNVGIAGLISGSTLTMTWIFETGQSPSTVEFSFGGDLLALGAGASISAMAITRYDDNTDAEAVQTSFEQGAHMLHEVDGVVAIPEPSTATLSLLALSGLAARRRRRY